MFHPYYVASQHNMINIWSCTLVVNYRLIKYDFLVAISKLQEWTEGWRPNLISLYKILFFVTGEHNILSGVVSGAHSSITAQQLRADPAHMLLMSTQSSGTLFVPTELEGAGLSKGNSCLVMSCHTSCGEDTHLCMQPCRSHLSNSA